MTKNLNPDIRCKQRLQNFGLAYDQLKAGIAISRKRALNDLEKQGLIQAFEYTHELAWNVMKDYFEYQGASQIHGSRDATKEAFQKNLVKDGEVWMNMIGSRNETSHTYNKVVAEQIVDKIVNQYQKSFEEFHQKMQELVKILISRRV